MAMDDERVENLGPASRRHCNEHPNCVYRLELLEAWRLKIDEKLEGFQRLLIANLGGIIVLLVTALGGAIFYIVQSP